MKLPKFLTTVTSFSKILAAVLFIVFPFAGFYIGLQYEHQFTKYLEDRTTVDRYIIKPSRVATQSASTANWKTYKNDNLGFSIQYPSSYKIEEKKSSNKTGGITFSSPDLIWTEYPEDNVPKKGAEITVDVYENKFGIVENAYAEYAPTLIFSHEANLDNAKATYTIKDHLSRSKSHTVSAKKNNRQFTLTVFFANQDEKNIVDIFQKILATFQFSN